MSAHEKTVIRFAQLLLETNIDVDVEYEVKREEWIIIFYSNNVEETIEFRLIQGELVFVIKRLLKYNNTYILTGTLDIISKIAREFPIFSSNFIAQFIPTIKTLLKSSKESILSEMALYSLGDIDTDESWKIINNFKEETKHPRLLETIERVILFDQFKENKALSLDSNDIVKVTEDLRKTTQRLQESMEKESLEPFRIQLGDFQQDLEKLTEEFKEFENKIDVLNKDMKNILNEIQRIPHYQTYFRGRDLQRQIEEINNKLNPLEKTVTEDVIEKQMQKDNRSKHLTIWGIFATIVSLILGVISILVKKGIL